MSLNRDRDGRLKIGLKYCGGCNPEYDRVAVKDQIEESLKDKVLFLPPESDDKEMILAILGCKIACADLSHFQGLKIWKITSVEDAEEFIKEMDSLLFKNDFTAKPRRTQRKRFYQNS